MTECDHNCPINSETTADEMRHYLDCPVWELALAAGKP